MRLIPLIIFLLFFVIPAAAFFLLIRKGVKRVKASEWRGEIVDKIFATKEEKRFVNKLEEAKGHLGKTESHTQVFYTLVVKGDDGLTRKVAVTKEFYDECQIGDRLVKPKGALNPRKE